MYNCRVMDVLPVCMFIHVCMVLKEALAFLSDRCIFLCRRPPSWGSIAMTRTGSHEHDMKVNRRRKLISIIMHKVNTKKKTQV